MNELIKAVLFPVLF